MDNKSQPTIQISGGTPQIIIQSTVYDNNNVTNSNNNAALRRIEKGIDEIKNNTEEIRKGQKAIAKMNKQQQKNLSKELIEWLTMAFVAFEGVVDDKFEEAKMSFEEAKLSDSVQVKAQLSLPLFVKFFTGLDLIVEVDVKNTLKNTAKTICQKLGFNNLIT